MKYYYSRILALFIAVLCVNSAFSQDREILPKGLTEAEKGIISQYEFKNSRLSDPPAGPVRAAAEWEEVEYLVVTWQSGFQGILRQIVAAGV